MASTLAKPAGLTVFPPHADPTGDCVLRRLLTDEPWREEPLWPEGFEGGIVHRLDVSTSGALLVADDPGDLERIRAVFAAGGFTKIYRFVTSRQVPWNDNRCERAIAHAPRRQKGRMVVQRGQSTPHRGRWYPARTEFERVQGELWQASMGTGVMHQIRVHAAFLGIPLAGDRRYGGGSSEHTPGVDFLLHHVGLDDGQGLCTEAVPLPEWARG